MTLHGAGYFDDESVWYTWIILMDRADIDILRHELCFLQTRVQQQNCLSQPWVAYHSYRACTCECQS